MNNPNYPENPTFTPNRYEICIEGRLGSQTAVWFEDMIVIVNEETTPPQTIIRGYIIDQTALYGLISRARDLGLTLLSVKHIDEDEDIKPQDFEGEAYDNIVDGQSIEDDS